MLRRADNPAGTERASGAILFGGAAAVDRMLATVGWSRRRLDGRAVVRRPLMEPLRWVRERPDSPTFDLYPSIWGTAP